MVEDTTKLAEKTNILDPKVVFDPTKETSTVATSWNTNNTDDAEAAENTVNAKGIADMTRVVGIDFPIIKIDSQVIPRQYINKFTLSYKGFVPSLYISVTKYPELILNNTGMVNKVTVIMIPPVDGTYKKISVDFYITNRDEFTNKYIFYCSYFFPELNKSFTTSLKNKDGICKMSTYDLVSSIATKCKLGFASSEKCKDIADTKTRLAINQTYTDVIQQHIKFGGIDNNSFFDCWIDVFGYLVLVNLSHIFSSKVQSNELSMKQLIGVNINDGNAENQIQYSTENVMRLFSNWKMAGKPTNNKILSYELIVNNSKIMHNGTDNKYFYLNHLTNSEGINDIKTENVTISEDTTDGELFKDAYTFQTNEYLGTEMGSKADGNTPVLIQEKRRDAYKAKLNSKILKVSLEQMNINIERGTLLNIMIYEYDRIKKAEIMRNTSNLSKSGDLSTTAKPVIDDETDDLNTEKLLEDSSIGVPNLELSGIYYVDGIEYIYNGNDKIEQYLYLIKHTGTANSYLNYSSLPKLKEIPENSTGTPNNEALAKIAKDILERVKKTGLTEEIKNHYKGLGITFE